MILVFRVFYLITKIKLFFNYEEIYKSFNWFIFIYPVAFFKWTVGEEDEDCTYWIATNDFYKQMQGD